MRQPDRIALLLAAVVGVAVLAVGVEGTALAPAAGDSHRALPPPGAVPGMIAVADSGNNRIQVFYPNGTFAAFMFGPPYQPDNRYNDHVVDIGPSGRVVVGDRVYYPNGTLAFSFEYGSALGRVNSMSAVAVGPDDRIIVADFNYGSREDRNRIQVFNPDGSFALAFGSRTGEDRLGYVSDVAVGPRGLIAVADGSAIRFFNPDGSPVPGLSIPHGGYGWSRIAFGPDGQIAAAGPGSGIGVYHQVFSPNGTVSFEGNRTGYGNGSRADFDWYHGSSGTGSTDIAFGPDGRLVVTDPFNHRVHVYHPVNAARSLVQHPNGSLVPSGSFALGFGYYGSVLREFDSPTDVAVGPDGRIVVAEPGNYSIRVFHSNGTAALEFGSRGSGDGHFYTPRHVAVGPDGRIVVGDTGKQRVLAFGPDGSPVLAFGSAGDGEREFGRLHDVAVGPDGRIVVADEHNGRVQVFHPNGSFALAIILDPDVQRRGYLDKSATHVAVGPDGQIVVGDDGGSEDYLYGYRDKDVRVFNPDGSIVFTIPDLGGPLAVGPDGRIVVAGEDGIEVFNPDGSFAFASRIETNLLIDAVAVGPDGRIVVVDSEGNRVQVFNPDGTHAFTIRPALAEGRFNGPTGVAVGPLVLPVVATPMDLPVIIGPSAGGLRNFTSAGDAANLTIDVTGLADPGGPPLDGSEASTVTFPPAETVVAASFAEVSFPPGVRASHVPADGVLALRVAVDDAPTAERVQDALGRNGSEIVLLQRVVEVGAEDSRVTFNLPIRILLEGQAGGRAFWVEGGGGAEGSGTITPIDVQCNAVDDTAAVHDQLGGAGECQVDDLDGGAKIVHTYHLTQFGTVASGGPAPQPVPAGAAIFDGGGAGMGNGTGPPPPVVPPVVVPAPAPAMCSMVVGSSDLSVSASPGEYSQPVGQTLINSGSLPFARVEIGATPWSVANAGGAPPPPPIAPPHPPPAPALGPNEGRLSGVLTARLVAALPAGATEVSEQGAGAGWVAVANGTTAVAAGLAGGDEAPLWFRLNLTPYPNLEAGTTLVQYVTYQAECAPPP